MLTVSGDLRSSDFCSRTEVWLQGYSRLVASGAYWSCVEIEVASPPRDLIWISDQPVSLACSCVFQSYLDTTLETVLSGINCHMGFLSVSERCNRMHLQAILILTYRFSDIVDRVSP